MSCLEYLVLILTAAAGLWRAYEESQADEEMGPYPRMPRPSPAQLRERARRVAEALRGVSESRGRRGQEVVMFRAAGREAQLWWGRSMTIVQIDLRGHSPGALLIHPNEGGMGLGHALGPDLKIGRHSFDDRYIVRAKPADLPARLFTAERRAALLATIEQLRKYRHATFDLNREALTVRVAPALEETANILELCRSAETFAEFVLEMGAAAPGIVWGEASTSPEGVCQVCGVGLEGQVVRCASCRTPHHRDCWTYIGECSTYACRETRFV